MAARIGPQAPVTDLPRVGPATAAKLATLGVCTVGELLLHLPRGHQDRTAVTPVTSLVPGGDAVVEGVVVAVRQGRRRGRSAGPLEARLDDGTAALSVVFFAAGPHVRAQWVKGARLRVMGRLDGSGPLRLVHPEVESLDAEGAAAHRDGVVPLYRLAEGMGQRAHRALVHAAFARLGQGLLGVVPPQTRAALGLPTRGEALSALHFPRDAAQLPALRAGTHRAHEALLFEDLLVLLVALGLRRAALGARGCAADALPRGRMGGARARATVAQRARARLAFTLTGAQERVLAEIEGDLAITGRPMHRLVQGDVGAGKTIVGLLAAAPILERGGQVAMIAPTELLVDQWCARAGELYAPLGVEITRLVGGLKAEERRAALASAASRRAGLFIGTHALLSEEVAFGRLALAVVDEQQRFGVFERARLVGSGPQPHLLALTATPIPRTLAHTLYGDMDLSLLDERPPRGPIRTRILPSARRGVAWEAARAEVERGGRVYVVCPRIDPAADGLRSVLETAEELAGGALRGVRLGVIHGGMDAVAQASVLQRFRGGEVPVLIGTTVIEVGLDVPEARLIVVENAERFGLAQLHQLRGRVGRSAEGGDCILLTPDPEAAPRIDVLAATEDGLAIAEADLLQRGPGDVVGARQAGTPAFALTGTPRFFALLAQAREVAAGLIAGCAAGGDPALEPLREAAARRLEDSVAVAVG